MATLTGTTVVRHPDTLAPIVLAAGAELPEWAAGLVGDHLIDSGEDVPAALGTKLLTFQNPDGGFTYEAGQPSDADSTALAMQALTALSDQDNLDKAIAWAKANVQADGSFAGFNPVNSTAVMAAALAPTGQNVADSVA